MALSRELVPDASVDERLQEIKPQILNLLELYKDPTSANFEIRDEVVRLLRSKNLFRRMRLHSRFVGVHPKNRYGDGITPSHVLQ